MDKTMTHDSREVLQKHGIPFEATPGAEGEQLVVKGDGTEPESLRRLGFRLGHGFGKVRYLLYFRGRYCGVVR